MRSTTHRGSHPHPRRQPISAPATTRWKNTILNSVLLKTNGCKMYLCVMYDKWRLRTKPPPKTIITTVWHRGNFYFVCFKPQGVFQLMTKIQLDVQSSCINSICTNITARPGVIRLKPPNYIRVYAVDTSVLSGTNMVCSLCIIFEHPTGVISINWHPLCFKPQW